MAWAQKSFFQAVTVKNRHHQHTKTVHFPKQCLAIVYIGAAQNKQKGWKKLRKEYKRVFLGLHKRPERSQVLPVKERQRWEDYARNKDTMSLSFTSAIL